MKNTWYVRVLLKNGKTIDCVIESECDNSDKFCNQIFAGHTNAFVIATPTVDTWGKEVVAFYRGEVAAYWVSTQPFPGDMEMK